MKGLFEEIKNKDLTIAQVFKMACENWGKRVVLRKKEYGIWNEITWEGFYRLVKHFGLGLLSLGFKKGDRVAIIGENSPQWLIAQIAAMAVNGVSLGIYQDCPSDEILFFIKHAEASFVLAEDQEQVDKVLSIKESLPWVKKVIFWDPKGLRTYQDPILMDFEQVVKIGAEYEVKAPTLFEECIARGNPEDLVHIYYTSGTKAEPKGVMESSRILLNIVKAFASRYPFGQHNELFSFAPFAWAWDFVCTILPSFLTGARVNFYEEPETVWGDLREIGPHVVYGPPRILESQLSEIRADIEDSSFFKRTSYKYFAKMALKCEKVRQAGQNPPFYLKLIRYTGYLFFFRAIQDLLGYKRANYVFTGGTFTGTDTFSYFRAIGVPLLNVYGLTEILGTHGHLPDQVKAETVGVPYDSIKTKISEEGEILISGSHCSLGYYKNPEATKKLVDSEGWVHTGDAGYIDKDGHLVILGRLSDMITTLDKTRFSPDFLENKLKFSPYIRDAIILGRERPFIAAIIGIDPITAARWAERKGLFYRTYTDLSQLPEIYQVIKNEIKQINKELPPHLRIATFANLHKELDADDAELTRTRKLRRALVEERYKELQEALYAGRPCYETNATVKYRDGSTNTITATINFTRVEE